MLESGKYVPKRLAGEPDNYYFAELNDDGEEFIYVEVSKEAYEKAVEITSGSDFSDIEFGVQNERQIIGTDVPNSSAANTAFGMRSITNHPTSDNYLSAEAFGADEETYLAMHGASRQDIGESALHKNRGGASDKTWDKIVMAQAAKDRELIERRDALRKEYWEKVGKGEIRPSSREERLVHTARGDESLESVQAARRLLAKKGIKWSAPVAIAYHPGDIVYIRGPTDEQKNQVGGVLVSGISYGPLKARHEGTFQKVERTGDDMVFVQPPDGSAMWLHNSWVEPTFKKGDVISVAKRTGRVRSLDHERGQYVLEDVSDPKRVIGMARHSEARLANEDFSEIEF